MLTDHFIFFSVITHVETGKSTCRSCLKNEIVIWTSDYFTELYDYKAYFTLCFWWWKRSIKGRTYRYFRMGVRANIMKCVILIYFPVICFNYSLYTFYWAHLSLNNLKQKQNKIGILKPSQDPKIQTLCVATGVQFSVKIGGRIYLKYEIQC